MKRRNFSTVYVRFQREFVTLPDFLNTELRRVEDDTVEHIVQDGEVKIQLLFLDASLKLTRRRSAKYVRLRRLLNGLARDSGVLVELG